MNREEVVCLLNMCIANLPHTQKMEMRPTRELWIKVLCDIPYELAEMAILKLITSSTERFLPNVGEIRKAVVEIMGNDTPNATDAWGEALKVINNYSHYGYCGREYNPLAGVKPLTAKTIKSMGILEMTLSENIDVTRGQFLRLYEQLAVRERHDDLMPKKLKENIEAVQQKKQTVSLINDAVNRIGKVV